MIVNGLKKHYSLGNKTTFIDEQNKRMLVMFTKDIDDLHDVNLLDNKIISENDRYTKYKGIVSKINCEYLVIENYTEQDYFKHTQSNIKMIKETPEYYHTIVLPNAIKMDKTWIYAILDGTAELDRILYQDENFVLLKDIKWNGDKLNEIHVLALPRRRDLLSIRDIDNSNLYLIEQIDKISRDVIVSMYNLPNDRIRSYFHYYPSYWHLHVHFDICGQENSSSSVDFCRPLHDVVENVKLDSNYYKKITLNVIKGYF